MSKEPKRLRLDNMLDKTTENITKDNVNTEAADGSERDKHATTSEEKSRDDENRNFESIDATEVTVALDEYVVAVYLDDHRPYVDKIIEIDNEDNSVDITFMEPFLKDDHNLHYLRWPKSEDNVWVDYSEILCVVPEPNECKRGYEPMV